MNGTSEEIKKWKDELSKCDLMFKNLVLHMCNSKVCLEEESSIKKCNSFQPPFLWFSMV